MKSFFVGMGLVLGLDLGLDLGLTGSQGAMAAQSAPPSGFVIENSAVLPLASRVSGRSYEVYVKTPPGYSKPENAGRRYPVLYLTDGPYTFQVASGLTRVPFNHGRFKEFIIVGISYAQGDVPADSRRRDLTPWRDPKMKGETGGADTFFRTLKTEVLPLVEGKYRIDPSQRTLGGQSFGGIFGLWILFHEPDLFRNYILTSSSIWFAGRQVLKDEDLYAKAHKDLKARVYLAVGEREHPGPEGCRSCTTDMVADQARLASLLKGRKYPSLELKTTVVSGGYHETTFPTGLIQAMQWLYVTD